MAKLLVYDLETTGVNHWQHGIHQISGMIIIDGHIKETFDIKCKPHHSALIEQSALEVGGITLEQIQAYPDQITAYSQLVSILSKYVDKFNKADKFHLVGYNNSSFDNQFLRAFFTQCFDKYFGSWFWADTIDVMVLASVELQGIRPTLPNFQLKTVANALDLVVDESKLHDAQYDLELTYGIYKMLLNKDSRLQMHRDSTVGLWATDKPEIIPAESKHLFFEITF